MSSAPDPDPSTLGIPNTSPESQFHDSLNLIASTVITGVAYGIMFTLYLICLHFLLLQLSQDKNDTATRRRTYFYIVYTTVMWILGTLYLVSNAKATDLAYVKHRVYEKGPAEYALLIYSWPITVLGNACWVILNWMTDALMLWRFIVLYRGTRYLPYLAVLPCLLYAGCLAFGFLTVIRSSTPANSLWSEQALNIVLTYFSFSISLTTVTTSLMLLRLFHFRQKFRGILDTRFSAQYTSIAAMLIESAALYDAVSLVFIVLYALKSPVQWVFLAALSQIQIIAPLLIIFRVAQGKAWNRKTQGTLLSSLAAARPPTLGHYHVRSRSSMTSASAHHPSCDSCTGDLSFVSVTPSSQTLNTSTSMSSTAGGSPSPSRPNSQGSGLGPGHTPSSSMGQSAHGRSKLGVVLYSASDVKAGDDQV